MAQPLSSLPHHVALIPDGNRRWAHARGLHSWDGHEAGAKNTEKIIEKARELGIRVFSFWGSSMENLTKRPFEEKRELLRLYEAYFTRMIENESIHKDRARIRLIGHWREQFPDGLRRILVRCEEETKNYDAYALNFFLAYSGNDDMLLAVRMLVASGISPDAISSKHLKSVLMTHDLPPVDYLIRTGGEPHLSAGFMMWDIADAQLYFSDKLYPDFDAAAFAESIEEYARRARRFGK
jgi:undecaprenyl diphosphate synthase